MRVGIKRLTVGSVALCSVMALTVAVQAPADAFGTVDGKVKQHAEHERITRVLGEHAQDGGGIRFQNKVLDLLAGEKGTLGAVGAPDRADDSDWRPIYGLGPGYKHCDDADYLPTANYPQSKHKAHDELDRCIEHFDRQLDRAVKRAGELVSSNGKLNERENDISNCSFGWKPNLKQPAKCEVLNGLGRALHLSEDFWSHSNWADEAANRPTGTKNPPGLNRTDIPDFLRYPVPKNYKIPDGLITGCDDSVTEFGCKGRVNHSVLAKDTGLIDPDTGVTEIAKNNKYPRGAVKQNFQKAVTGARLQARTTWSDLQNEIVKHYGNERGQKIVHAIVTNAPWSGCDVVAGGATRALAPPSDSVKSARSFRVTVLNETGEPLSCTVARLSSGEWTNMPEAKIAGSGRSHLRSQSHGLATGTEGEVMYRIGATGPRNELIVKWNNPYLGGNDFSCKVPSGYECKRSGSIKGLDADVTVTISKV